MRTVLCVQRSSGQGKLFAQGVWTLDGAWELTSREARQGSAPSQLLSPGPEARGHEILG